jgi:UrcA family protein
MKASIKSTRRSAPLTIAIVGAIVMSCSAVSFAGDSSDLPRTIVKFADLDIATHEGAAALYGRIAAAAEKVCNAHAVDTRDLRAKASLNACLGVAIEGAVTRLDQPALSAIYTSRNHRRVASIVATADPR